MSIVVLFPDHCEMDATSVRIAAVFEKENALPGAELHLPINDRNRFAALS